MMHFSNTCYPRPRNPKRFFIFHHERVELKTLAHKPPGPLPLLDSYDKFTLSKLLVCLLFFSPNLIFILIFLLLLFSKENMAITVALGKGIPVNFLLIFLLHEPSTSNN